MNLLACVASYAREVAQTQPLACAKLLTFGRVADYRAVLADLDAAHPSRAFFALGAEIFALREHPNAADAAFRDREWARLYPALVRLVPLPPDTPWQRCKDNQERLFRGYRIELFYARRPTKRLSFGVGSPPQWRLTVSAKGAPCLVWSREWRMRFATLRKELESYVIAHPIETARIAAFEEARDG